MGELQSVRAEDQHDPTGAASGAGQAAEVHLPSPSLWPLALAAGAALLFFGIVTTYVFSLVGGLLLLAALAAWIGDMRHESH